MVFFWNIASWDFIFEHLRSHHVISNLFSFFFVIAFSLKEPLWYLFSIQLHNHKVFIPLLLFLWMITVVCSMWSESDSGLLLLVLQCLQCIFYKYDIQPWWSQLDERKLIKSFFTYFVHFRHFGENFIIRKKNANFHFLHEWKHLSCFLAVTPMWSCSFSLKSSTRWFSCFFVFLYIIMLI